MKALLFSLGMVYMINFAFAGEWAVVLPNGQVKMSVQLADLTFMVKMLPYGGFAATLKAVK